MGLTNTSRIQQYPGTRLTHLCSLLLVRMSDVKSSKQKYKMAYIFVQSGISPLILAYAVLNFRTNISEQRWIYRVPEYCWILDVLVNPIRWYHKHRHKREDCFVFDLNCQEHGKLALNWMQYMQQLLPNRCTRQYGKLKWKLEISTMSLSIQQPK